jgi:hypothetical protein
MSYQLIFAGEIKEGLNPDEVKEAFARIFRVSERQLEYLFSGESHVIKKNLTQDKILKYIVKLDDIGVISYVDIIGNELQLPTGVTKDRRIRERRIRYDRRAATRSNILPDRRRVERRKHN